jgi:Hemerythrin HHE cation binding domain.
MVLAMHDEDYLFRIYHFILAKYRREEHKAEHEEIEERKAEIIRIVSELESLDIIESAYSFIMGMLSVKKGGISDV